MNKRGDTFSLGDRANVLDCVYNHDKPLMAHEHLLSSSSNKHNSTMSSSSNHSSGTNTSGSGGGEGQVRKFPCEMIFRSRSILCHLII